MSPSEDQADQDRPPSGGQRTRTGSRRARLQIEISGCPEGMEQALRDAARRALRSQSYRQGTLEIAIVGDAEMRRQHDMWMGLDTPTDVLSFDLRDDVGVPPQLGSVKTNREVDGQLIVCKSVARRRARVRGSDWQAELILYVVHGCLHLCGHDDRDPDDAAKMHEQEDRILTALGWGPVFTGGNRRPHRPLKHRQRTGRGS